MDTWELTLCPWTFSMKCTRKFVEMFWLCPTYSNVSSDFQSDVKDNYQLIWVKEKCWPITNMLMNYEKIFQWHDKYPTLCGDNWKPIVNVELIFPGDCVDIVETWQNKMMSAYQIFMANEEYNWNVDMHGDIHHPMKERLHHCHFSDFIIVLNLHRLPLESP